MSRYDEIPVDRASRELDRFRLIDVRQEHEFHGPLGRISGAELVPLAEIGAHRERLSSGGESLLLVCRSGGRSGKACEALAGADVTNLSGGMIAWNRAGLPVDRTPADSVGAALASLTAYFAQVGGSPLGEAQDTVHSLLGTADPDVTAVDRVITRIEVLLAEGGVPPDLDLVTRALRNDLSGL